MFYPSLFVTNPIFKVYIWKLSFVNMIYIYLLSVSRINFGLAPAATTVQQVE